MEVLLSSPQIKQVGACKPAIHDQRLSGGRAIHEQRLRRWKLASQRFTSSASAVEACKAAIHEHLQASDSRAAPQRWEPASQRFTSSASALGACEPAIHEQRFSGGSLQASNPRAVAACEPAIHDQRLRRWEPASQRFASSASALGTEYVERLTFRAGLKVRLEQILGRPNPRSTYPAAGKPREV